MGSDHIFFPYIRILKQGSTLNPVLKIPPSRILKNGGCCWCHDIWCSASGQSTTRSVLACLPRLRVDPTPSWTRWAARAAPNNSNHTRGLRCVVKNGGCCWCSFVTSAKAHFFWRIARYWLCSKGFQSRSYLPLASLTAAVQSGCLKLIYHLLK